MVVCLLTDLFLCITLFYFMTYFYGPISTIVSGVL